MVPVLAPFGKQEKDFCILLHSPLHNLRASLSENKIGKCSQCHVSEKIFGWILQFYVVLNSSVRFMLASFCDHPTILENTLLSFIT